MKEQIELMNTDNQPKFLHFVQLDVLKTIQRLNQSEDEKWDEIQRWRFL